MKVYQAKVMFGFPSPLGQLERGVTWSLQGPDSPTGSQVGALASALATFHRGFLAVAYLVDRVVLSTWEPDSKPYNPNVVSTFPVAQHGTRTIDSQLMPLSDVLHVRRLALNGRNGHMFMRGYLQSSDLTDSGGVVALANPATVAGALETAFAALQESVGPDWVFGIITKEGVSYNFRNLEAIGAPVVSASSTHRPRKPFVSPSDPLAQMGHILEKAGATAETINTIIEVFNALPVIPDVPLLP